MDVMAADVFGGYTPPPPAPPPAPPQMLDYRATGAAHREVPTLSFDDDVQVIARVSIAGELFDIPPMPASAMGWYARIVNEPMDDPAKAFDMIVEFITRCVLTDDQARCRAALARSNASITKLMEQGSRLMELVTGFPTRPSQGSPSPQPHSGESSTVAASPPGTAASPG